MTPDSINLAEATRSLMEQAAMQAGVSPSEFVEQAVKERLAGQAVRSRRERLMSLRTKPEMTQEEWKQFVTSVAGSIPDPTFRRHDQGTFESQRVRNGDGANS